MIINFHGHPNESMLAEMEEHGIDRSVLLPIRGYRALARHMAQQHPERFVAFYWVELENPELAVKNLEYAVQHDGYRGIKFQPLVQRFRPNERRIWPIYEKCVQLNIPVLFHAGAVPVGLDYPHFNEYGDTPVYLDEVAYAFPDLKIVIAHMGGNYAYEALVVAEKHANIYMDTAFLPTICQRLLPPLEPIDMIKRGVRFLGAERILYGYEGLSPQVIRDSDFTEGEKELILGQNATRLLEPIGALSGGAGGANPPSAALPSYSLPSCSLGTGRAGLPGGVGGVPPAHTQPQTPGCGRSPYSP